MDIVINLRQCWIILLSRVRAGQMLIAMGLVGAVSAPALGADNNIGLERFETGLKYYDVDSDLSDTHGGYLTMELRTGANNVVRGEISYLDRFDDSGTFYSIGNTRDFQSWYVDASVGGSSGGFFWPRLRLDIALGHRWLADQNLVTSVSVGYIDAKDEHSDRSLSLEAVYYTQGPWIIQAGIRFNKSDPGSVYSSSNKLALTHNLHQRRLLSLSFEEGDSAYQAIGLNDINSFTVDVPFKLWRATWMEWLDDGWGTKLTLEAYLSESYNQRGVEMAVFRDF